MPITVKLFDGLLHNHHHLIKHHTKEISFNQLHEKCLIPSFETYAFSWTKLIHFTKKTNSFIIINTEHSSVYCYAFPKYSFLLRAPPVI